MTSIIIGTKNRLEYLKILINSIKENTKDYEIIVVDDVSIDGTFEWLRKQDFRSITNNQSIPVADAWNLGCYIAKGKYLVLLNDDMIVTPDWLETMINFYESYEKVGSLAFKVYDDQGLIQSRGHSFNKSQPYLPEEDAVEVDYSDHPFVKKSVWEMVGGFTAHGKLYYEDSDFGLKLQSFGLKNYYVKDAVLKHVTVGLRIGTEKDREIRKYNESVIQQQSKISFYNKWRNYLENRI